MQNLPIKKFQTVLASATADSKTMQIAKQYLKTSLCFFNMNTLNDLVDATGVPIKLNHYYMVLNIEQRMDTLFSFIKSHLDSKCIVFF